jgi:hypothetical protein
MKRTSPYPRLGKEVILEASKLSNPEARFMVSSYYASQEMRKRLDMQLRHLGKDAIIIPQYLNTAAEGFSGIEADMAKILEKFAAKTLVGRWAMNQVGCGPIITAGLLAHLDITKAPTAGHFWSFTNINPIQEWKKGEKRPYCPEAKQLCFHLGECFKRTSGKADAFYGQLYKSFKARVVAKNDRGDFAERAKTFKTNSNEVKKKLKQGKLPDGNLDRQAANQAVKIFLSHLHAVMYDGNHGTRPRNTNPGHGNVSWVCRGLLRKIAKWSRRIDVEERSAISRDGRSQNKSSAVKEWIGHTESIASGEWIDEHESIAGNEWIASIESIVESEWIVRQKSIEVGEWIGPAESIVRLEWIASKESIGILEWIATHESIEIWIGSGESIEIEEW